MRIALVYDLIYPFSVGGVESRNFSLAEYLVLRGHIVHIFGVKMWKGPSTIKPSKNQFVHGVSRYSSKYTFKGNRKISEPLIYSVLLAGELLKYEFDILDVSAFPYFPVFSAKLYSVLKKRPMVITWHEVWDKYWKNFGFAGHFGRPAEKICSRLSQHNICVSRMTRKKLLGIGTKESNTVLITNWINFEEIRTSKPTSHEYDII